MAQAAGSGTTPGIVDVTSDQDRAGPQVNVVIDRDAAARLGINTTAIDNALNNAYSQRQISTIYAQRNQYKVVLEIDPQLQADPSMLDRIYVGATGGKQVPLSAVAHFERGNAPLAVRHQGQFPAATLSFNLAPGLALGDAGMWPTTPRANSGGVRTDRRQCALPATIPRHPAARIGAADLVHTLGAVRELPHPLTIIPRCPRPASQRCSHC
jgi:multidrug efflux pump